MSEQLISEQEVAQRQAEARAHVAAIKARERRLMPIRQAWLDGADLQWRTGPGDEWTDVDEQHQTFVWEIGEWRVRPAPVEQWQVWRGRTLQATYTTRAALEEALDAGEGAERLGWAGSTIHHYREVTSWPVPQAPTQAT